VTRNPPGWLALAALLTMLGAFPAVAQQGAAPPLVTVEKALLAAQPVQVAATVDHGTVAERQVGGSPGVGFSVTGASGERMEVEVAGKLPPGFAVAATVVLVGTAQDGRFHANRVLIPGAGQETDEGRGLKAVLGVTMVVWVGLFLYVFRLDRRLRQLEE
jgi:CcmD family protein